MHLPCFKAYDVRGRVGTDLTPEICTRIGRAFAQVMPQGPVVLGRDNRDSSPTLSDAVAGGLRMGGREVLDISQGGTEEVYFATSHLNAAGGIEITASHNPLSDNGLKFVGPGSRPLEHEGEYLKIKHLVETAVFPAPARVGTHRHVSTRAAYADKIVGFVDPMLLAPLTVVLNVGNGAAGAALGAISDRLAQAGSALRLIPIHDDAQAGFPNGVPNPLLPQNRAPTIEAVLHHKADLGVAFDGDFDRCFLFDETGAFIDGEHVVALLARALLAREPGAAIVHDPRVVFSIRQAIAQGGGRAFAAPTGHANLKRAMREHQAVYGGEMSAHHYFRDFMFCDSGMIPWLMVAALMSRTGQPLSALTGEMRREFPSSGEINFRVADLPARIETVLAAYGPKARQIDHLDGLSMEFADWRLNLRASNTEPLLRLNIEARGDAPLVAHHLRILSAMLSV